MKSIFSELSNKNQRLPNLLEGDFPSQMSLITQLLEFLFIHYFINHRQEGRCIYLDIIQKGFMQHNVIIKNKKIYGNLLHHNNNSSWDCLL